MRRTLPEPRRHAATGSFTVPAPEHLHQRSHAALHGPTIACTEPVFFEPDGLAAATPTFPEPR